MKSFGLLAASLTVAQAWVVTLYGEDGCTGESHYMKDYNQCGQPPNVPANFDAKSVGWSEMPLRRDIHIYTDNNTPLCSTPNGQHTWIYFQSTKSSECWS